MIHSREQREDSLEERSAQASPQGALRDRRIRGTGRLASEIEVKVSSSMFANRAEQNEISFALSKEKRRNGRISKGAGDPLIT